MARKQNARRADGRIAVQVYLGRRADGTREYKTVYGKTQKEAEKKAEQVKLSMNKGLDISASRDTFGEWAERWADLKSHEISAARMVTYRCNLKHLAPLDRISICDIRPADIQRIIYQLAEKNPNTGKPTAAKTLKGIYSVARQVFQMAIDNRIIEFNPLDAVSIPKGQPKSTKRAITDEERQWIENTPHRAQTAAMIMLYAGLRRGEVIPLQWSDIDLNARTITVNKSVAKEKSAFVVKGGGKTENSTRIIDIPLNLVEFLEQVKKESLFVVPDASGGMLSPIGWKRLWESYLNTLNVKYGKFENCLTWKNGKKITRSITEQDKYNPNGLPFVIQRFTAHDLRHTFATMLYFAGVDILTAKEQLGHADARTTMEIYTHLDRKFKRKSMDKLDDYLKNASQMQVSKS